MATNLLTARQVAEQLTISQRMVYDLAVVGKLSSFRIGGAVRFDQADVDGFREACRRNVGQAMPGCPGPAKVVNVRVSDPNGESELAAYFRKAGIAPKPRLSERPQRRKP